MKFITHLLSSCQCIIIKNLINFSKYIVNKNILMLPVAGASLLAKCMLYNLYKNSYYLKIYFMIEFFLKLRVKGQGVCV